LLAYRLPNERPPLRRRLSGLALALGFNLLLLLVLLGIGNFSPVVQKASRALVVDLLPESHDRQSASRTTRAERPQPKTRPLPKLPKIILPVRPTIAPPPKPPDFVEMSKADMAAADIGNLPKSGAGSAGDSEEVGRGPHGEVLYNAEWARHPTDAELSASDGYGLIACRTVAGNRVEDCVELDQEPRGSHLASAVRQAAWQFRVRPPRKNGRPMIGEWVQIRIDYENIGRN
jgi:protein TonB